MMAATEDGERVAARATAVPLPTIETRDIEFPSGSLRLSGVLHFPMGPAPERGWPALVFTGPFSGVKEQVVGHYAAELAAAGFVTLAFDHRNFGASEALVAQHEDSAGKLTDLRAATSSLATLPQVDAGRLGCVGICLGGGYALRHSAFDPRIRALAVVAGAFNDPVAMRRGMGAAGYREAMTAFAAVEQREYVTQQIEYLPAVAPDGGEAAMPGAEPWEYYGTARSTSAGWVNRVTRLSIRELLTFDAASAADFIGPTPTLVVHGRTDEFCSPAAAQAVHERIAGTKEIMWLDTTNHIDLYDQPEFVEPAVARIQAWMAAHL